MRAILQRIDVKKLAGVKRILGIDLTDSMVRVVELRNRGSILNRFKPDFRAEKCFSLELDPDASPKERGANLHALLLAHKVKSRYAVSSVQSSGTRVATAQVPNEIENIDEWIDEHREKLLKIPVPRDQIIWQHEILARGETTTTIEVSFVRSSEVEVYEEIFRNAGFRLIALGFGMRDGFNPWFLKRAERAEEDSAFAYVGKETISITEFRNGRRLETRFGVRNGLEGLERQIVSLVEPGDYAFKRIIVSGVIGEQGLPENMEILEPFGLTAEYSLASGLAIKGFLPEISPADFIKGPEKARLEDSIYSSLSRRVIVALGILTILLLGAVTLAGLLIQSEADRLDSELLSSDSTFVQVARLEDEIKNLEGRSGGTAASPKKTNYSRIIHELAALTPDKVWLYRLSLVGGEVDSMSLSVKGYAKSNEDVTEFLKNLRTRGLWGRVDLVRSGSPARDEFSLPPRSRGEPYVAFEVKATVEG